MRNTTTTPIEEEVEREEDLDELLSNGAYIEDDYISTNAAAAANHSANLAPKLDLNSNNKRLYEEKNLNLNDNAENQSIEQTCKAQAAKPPRINTNNVNNNHRVDSSQLDSGKAQNDSVGSLFKSANWLSDSELIFSLTNQVGGLVRALRIFQELDIGIKHVESRKSKRRESEFEIFVDIDCSDQEKMKKLVHHLR